MWGIIQTVIGFAIAIWLVVGFIVAISRSSNSKGLDRDLPGPPPCDDCE